MNSADELKAILEHEYGIKNMKGLDKAISGQKRLDISILSRKKDYKSAEGRKNSN